MLWVNLIMDSLGSLELATEPPNEKYLTEILIKEANIQFQLKSGDI
jgi:hypothetical protein